MEEKKMEMDTAGTEPVSPGTATDYLARQTELLEQQVELQKKTYRLVFIAAVCAAAMLIIIVGIGLILIPEIQKISISLETTARSLDSIAKQLEESNFGEAVEKLLRLVNEAETNIDLLREKLDALDFKGLNDSIKRLAEIISPIANLFGRN